MSRKTLVTVSGLFSSVVVLLVLALIFLRAGETAKPDDEDQVWIDPTERTPTLPPLRLEVEATATPLPSPTPLPTEPLELTSTPVPTMDVALLPTVPYTALQPATLAVSDWGSSGASSGGGGGGGGAAVLPAGVNTTGRCMGVTTSGVYVNIRDYPGLSAGVQGTIYPDQAYEIIAVALEDDAVWYGLEKGWVAGSVVNIYGDTCYILPNASKVAWRSFGHVDFASTTKYREVKNIKIERYMLNYPMLIFENGTIWHNPNGWNSQ